MKRHSIFILCVSLTVLECVAIAQSFKEFRKGDELEISKSFDHVVLRTNEKRQHRRKGSASLRVKEVKAKDIAREPLIHQFDEVVILASLTQSSQEIIEAPKPIQEKVRIQLKQE